jgi:DNA-binding NarL/FixJ family response regulator
MKLVIVDDNCLVSSSLKTILEAGGEITVSATGTDGTDAVKLYREHLPDILLMDIRMKSMNGLEATAEIRKEFPDAKILLLTTFSDDEYIVKALQAGAKGYLLKQDYTSLLPALSAVASGQTVFGCEVVSKLPGLFRKAEGFDYAAAQISARELEIIRLVADGLSNKEIASELFLSEGTVRNYLSDILDKLNLRDRTQVAVFYYQHQSNTP